MMKLALPIRGWSWMMWRLATSTNTRIVATLSVVFALVVSAGL